jgi:ABC-type transporter lipoprotein component MlaA
MRIGLDRLRHLRRGPAANDPYEQTNRDCSNSTARIDKYFVIPTVGVYFFLVPEGGRRGVHNFRATCRPPFS